MLNPIANSILKALGGAAVEVVRHNMPAAQPTSSKKKTGGCTPCEAKARVAAARRMVRGK